MSRKTKYAGLLIIGWVLIVICAYYVFHKPFSPEQFENLIKASVVTITAGILLSVAGAIGNLIYKDKGLTALELFSVQAVLGFGVLGMVFLIQGVTIGYKSWSQWAFLILTAVVLRKNIRAWWQQGKHLLKRIKGGTTLDKGFWSLVVFIVILAYFRALAPPVKYDSLVYHLSLPRRYILEGKFHFVEENMFWGMPQTMELLFTGAMTMAGPKSAILLSWVWGVIALVLIYALVDKTFGQTAGVIAVLSLLSGFSLAQSLSWGYTGWMNILWGGSFLIVFQQWVLGDRSLGEQAQVKDRYPSLKGLVLAGVFAGFALGTKYTSGLLMVSGIVMILYTGRKDKTGKLLLKLMLFLGAAIIVFTPWLIKNYFGTGNPIYPLFFSSGSMDNFRISFYQNYPRDLAWWQVLSLPVSSGIQGKEGALGFGASVGPLLTAFSFLTLMFYGRFSNREKKVIQLGWILAFVTYGLWIVGSLMSGHLLQTRLYFSGFPALALLAGAGYKSVCERGRLKMRIPLAINALVITVLVLAFYQQASVNNKSGVMANLLAHQSDQKYLETNLGWYAAAMEEISYLPEKKKVLLLWEPRGYYCLPNCDSDEIIDRWVHDLNTYQQGKNVITQWQQQGYTHVLYYQSGANYVQVTDSRYEEAIWLELKNTLGTLNLEKNFGDVYQLYRLGD